MSKAIDYHDQCINGIHSHVSAISIAGIYFMQCLRILDDNDADAADANAAIVIVIREIESDRAHYINWT